MARTWSNVKKTGPTLIGKRRSPVTPFAVLMAIISVYFLWLVIDMTHRAFTHPPTQRYVPASERE